MLEEDIDIVIIELGANDGLRGIPLTETASNLQAMVDQVQKELPNAKIILAGMKIPPNMGPAYTAEFESIFPDLASKIDLYEWKKVFDIVDIFIKLNINNKKLRAELPRHPS